MKGDKVWLKRGDSSHFCLGDTFSGIVLTEFDLPIGGEVKEPFKNDWYDEHGDDEYVPQTAYLKSFEFELGLHYQYTGKRLSTAVIDAMVSWMCAGEFVIFIEGYEWGKSGVRFVTSADAPDIHRYRTAVGTSTNWTWDIDFKIKLKVNKPQSSVTAVYVDDNLSTLNITE